LNVEDPAYFGKTPAANIIDSEEKFKIELAVPGFQKEDFKLEVQLRSLKVTVEKTEQEKTETVLRREFEVANFSRTFRLPLTVETDAIEASYEDGILNILIPKKEEAKAKEPRLVSIN
jgi:HSP20 family protein